ncbi:MAG TPA: DeoR/GlpR family DNA-binding transcription regulator [Candidatus Limnocylindrales bacterium]|nr:DeoR/GlpR family DNA-binding transcription regulator [Candidatus Limnocylindrales bacterium]
MLIVERRQRILDVARARGTVSAHDLAQALGTSEVTVRRDIRLMAAAGQLRRTRGGAMIAADLVHDPSSDEKARVAAREKAAIAELAATLVDDGSSIILGPGTTTLALARLLVDRRDLTVVTTSLLIPPVFARSPHVEVVLTGGTIRPSIDAVVGPAAERSLRSLRADRAFLSGTGFSAARGLTTPNLLVAATDQALIEAAAEAVVIADGEKIGREAMFNTVAAEAVDILITNDAADPEELANLRAIGIDVRIAPAQRRDGGVISSDQ